ncbi:hypothetical protein TELCIR_08158 [Teladorsagia circumcincta]|uniref:G protein-coupled receptor n=1 Tax=Teladorsagia circumcincta TaxID=45464 RepID=A0A2G9UJT4_TELCI|nr:hypothetical protein TELCIR_08158 [Teladorsagia circumcincta]
MMHGLAKRAMKPPHHPTVKASADVHGFYSDPDSNYGCNNTGKILPYARSLDFDNVMNVTIHEHPGQRLEEYGEFGGFLAATAQMRAYAVISFTIVAASPIIILYFKHLILRELHNSIDERSERIKSISKVFVKALTAQAMVPLCCYLPIGLLFNMSKAYQWDLVIVEYLLAGIAALPCCLLSAEFRTTAYPSFVLLPPAELRIFMPDEKLDVVEDYEYELSDIEIQQLKEHNQRRVKRVVALVAVLMTLLALGLVTMSLALGNRIDMMDKYLVNGPAILTDQRPIRPKDLCTI